MVAQTSTRISGVIKNTAGDGVADVNIFVSNVEQRNISFASSISNTNGTYSLSFKTETDSVCISVSGMNVKPTFIVCKNKSQNIDIIVEEKVHDIDEFVVKADPNCVKNLNDGIVYNLAKDKYAKEDNLLNALNRVPMLMVSSDGNINVAGKNSYVIYLNGKPYNVANAEPAQVLRSIPSSNVKQIEVVTRPGHRFGESAPVINIITKGNSLEGYHINISGMGATTPKAIGATSLLGVIDKIQFYAGYTYELWRQRDQKSYFKYSFGNENNTFTSSNKNHYNRHTHQGKALMQWDVDTLKQLYADFHINGINHNKKDYYEEGCFTDNMVSSYKSSSDTWDASLEANVIYSNRFKNSKAQKWRMGYRFTMNPDNRDYQIEDLSLNSITRSKTNGKLYTHNLQLYRRLNFNKNLFSFLTLNTHVRKGSSESRYAYEGETDIYDDFRYTQILSSLNWRTMWYITKSNDLWIDFANRFEYADEKSSDMESHRHSFSYLPSAKLIWQPNWDNEFSLAFNSHIIRPSLQMLNPFIGGNSNNDVLQGSPELKDSRAYSLSLGYSYFGKKFSIFPTVIGSFTRHSIMSVFNTDKTFSQLIETYSNISKVKSMTLKLFMSYRPWQWLTLRNVSSCGIQDIEDYSKSLNQTSRFYRSASVITFNIPDTWKIEARFNCYRLQPKAWIKYDPGYMYGFSISKTFMKGNMYVSVFADSPFDKHGEFDSHTIMSAPNVSYDKLWKIQNRCFGIEVSINLRGGKKVKLERNTSLKDTDIKTGIAN